MASRISTAILLVASLILAVAVETKAGNIAVYWGQNGRGSGGRNEGTLADTCRSGNYGVVIIAFLLNFGHNETPKLSLSYHCTGTCYPLNSQVKFCQSKGVKVLLSLGGGTSRSTLSSSADAKKLADYLWNNYLGGSSGSRPIGNAVLDGIDLDIEYGAGAYLDDLAKYLKRHSNKVLLSAAPQCPYPDKHLNKALSTGLFDYVWIQFYNNPVCDYSRGTNGMRSAWNKWTSSVKAGKFYIGLPASSGGAGSGYVPASDLKSVVLPIVKRSSKYGGVMLWNRYLDLVTGYSNQVKASV